MTTFIYYKDKFGIYLKEFTTGSIVFVGIDDFNSSVEEKGLEKSFIEILKNILEGIENKKCLSVMIVTNMSCNLCCSYCFEKEKTNSFLKISDIDKIIKNIDYIFHKNNFETIDITFTGGEPSLNFSFIEKITKKLIKNFSKEIINFSIISNGMNFKDNMLEFFDKYNFGIQITFDGNKKIHNLERKTENNIGSYDLILKNIENILLNYKFNVSIRFNITRFNFDTIEEVLLDLSKILNYSKLKLYFDFLDVEKSSIYYLKENEKIEISKYLIDIFLKYDFTFMKEYIQGGFCMYKNNVGYTISSDLNIYKCYSLVENKNFIFSKLEDLENIDGKGNLCNNTLCNVYELCYGGCPFSKYVVSGKMDKVCKYKFLNFFNRYLFKKELEKELDLKVDFMNVHLKKIDLKEGICLS